MSRLRRDEGGFTLIEVVIAALCLALILGAAATLFGTGNASSLASQRQAEAVDIADHYMENIRQALKTNTYGFSALAMNATPLAGTGGTAPGNAAAHTDPNDFAVSAAGCGASNRGYQIESNWDNTGEGTASTVSSWSGCGTGVEPLVIDTLHGIVQPSQTVTIGSGSSAVTGTVDSYVTDTNVGCASTDPGGCNSSNAGTPLGDARRVIVAVVIDSGGSHRIGPNTPIYISSIFTNPVPSNQSNTPLGITVGASLG